MSEVTFGLLGPVELRVGDEPHAPGGPRTAAVLAALLLHANQVVTVERLIDAAWGDSPPGSARTQVQNRVSGLRQLLRGLGGEVVIETRGAGYLISIDRRQLDVHVFEDRVDRAREQLSRGDAAGGASVLRSALSVWRGAALEGLEAPRLVAAAQRLDEARLAIYEELIDVEIALRRHGSVIGELVELVAEHPWRERLTAQLMTALHRADRQHDALAHFDRIRRRLRDELGVDPGPELVRLRDMILGAPQAIDTRASTEAQPGHAGGPATPRQLPAPVRSLIGREQELDAIVVALRGAGEARSTPVVVAIHGPAGVGKSALAVAAGHATSADFPDGQIYVDLQGVQSGGLAPLTPDEVIGRFLRAFGAAPASVPLTPGEATARFRSLMAQRRVIIIADNASSAEQVLPLLPAAGTCAVVVTSSQVLGMLDGDIRLDLGPLTADGAAAMLASLVGSDRAAAEPAAVAKVARACGHLPLALKVAGARLVGRPDWSFADLARRLADERRTMRELNATEPTLRASLRVSWLGLTVAGGPVDKLAAAAFLAIGALRVPTVKPSLVAAVTSVTPRLAELALDRLVEVRLLGIEHGRYRMHDVLRTFAAELAESDPATNRERLVETALRWYAVSAEKVNRLMRGPHATGSGAAVPALADPDLTDPVSAGAWLDAERASLVALVRHALASPSTGGLAAELVLTAYPAILMRGHGYEWETLCKYVLDAPGPPSDPRIAASIWTKLAVLYSSQHRTDEALDCVERALPIHRSIGDLPGTASALEVAGTVHVRRGDPQSSLPLYEQALALRRDLDDPFAEGITLSNAAQAYHRLGLYEKALTYLERSLAIRQVCGDLAGEAIALLNLGEVSLALERHQEVRRYAEAAITCSRRAGTRENERRSIALRARGYLRSGAIAAALRDCEAAVALAEAAGGATDPTEFAELIGELEAVGEHEHAERVRAVASGAGRLRALVPHRRPTGEAARRGPVGQAHEVRLVGERVGAGESQPAQQPLEGTLGPGLPHAVQDEVGSQQRPAGALDQPGVPRAAAEQDRRGTVDPPPQVDVPVMAGSGPRGAELWEEPPGGPGKPAVPPLLAAWCVRQMGEAAVDVVAVAEVHRGQVERVAGGVVAADGVRAVDERTADPVQRGRARAVSRPHGMEIGRPVVAGGVEDRVKPERPRRPVMRVERPAAVYGEPGPEP
jgi:DNA-binding SARP family transcriptional activator/tetratricopeptide (TPR) repeat protein